MTTTAQNTNISPNSPARKSPGNALCPQNLGWIAAISPLPTSRPSPHLPPPKKNIYTYIFPNGKPGENSLFCAMNKYIPYINNLKKCKMHIISFFFKYIYMLLKSDVNQMKPTWAMYFLQSLQGHSLGFRDLILFLNFFNELQFFILFGTISQILALNT